MFFTVLGWSPSSRQSSCCGLDAVMLPTSALLWALPVPSGPVLLIVPVTNALSEERGRPECSTKVNINLNEWILLLIVDLFRNRSPALQKMIAISDGSTRTGTPGPSVQGKRHISKIIAQYFPETQLEERMKQP